jgi:hypothetical protein
MKQCPKCRQVFADGRLNFCRSDGARLVSTGVTPDEVETIPLSRRQFFWLKARHKHSKKNA